MKLKKPEKAIGRGEQVGHLRAIRENVVTGALFRVGKAGIHPPPPLCWNQPPSGQSDPKG
jgi:hypothetical protein